jgi:aryl-alcohol dehydrogenase-like predicted oxidoreductase
VYDRDCSATLAKHYRCGEDGGFAGGEAARKPPRFAEMVNSYYRILDACFDAGGSFLDTANNYACWIGGSVGDESESLLGQYFADRGNRKDVFLVTKLGARTVERADGSEGAEGR